MKHASVSQITLFDRCERLWWFSYVEGRKSPSGPAALEGIAGHELLERWFKFGTMPAGRVKMGKAVTAAILKGVLPAPAPDLLVEERFDGQDRLGPDGVTWLPLDVENTLTIAGVPLEGFIDLAWRRGPRPTILDHKFKSNIGDAIAREDLIKTVQMPIYVASQLPYWPDATEWTIAHHNVSRSGTESRIVAATVHIDQVLARVEQISNSVRRMAVSSTATHQDDVKASPGLACEMYGGCHLQSVCTAFKKGIPTMSEISKAELALFAEFESPAVVTVTAEPVASVTTPVLSPPRRRMPIVDESSPTPVSILPPDAPASDPLLASEQPAAPKEPKPRRVKASAVLPLDLGPVAPLQNQAIAVGPTHTMITYTPEPMPTAPIPPPIAATVPELVNVTRAVAVAEVLESIARLIRAA